MIAIRTSKNTMTTVDLTRTGLFVTEYMWTPVRRTGASWLLWANPQPTAKNRFEFASRTNKFNTRTQLEERLLLLFGSQVEW